MTIKLSIIIPLFNEEESLVELHRLICQEITNNSLSPYEIVFIDDGSNDDSLEVLQKIQLQDSNVRIISFFRNYGKAAALAIGFKHSQGKYVITMDADLQDNPKEIAKFIQLAEKENYDLISGWKKKRHDSLEKKIPSKFFNFITSKVGGIKLHDFNCGLKFYKRKVVNSIYHMIYGDTHRFIPLLAHWSGFKVGEMVVEHQARKHGISKYGFMRYFHGFIDLLSLSLLNKFKSRPMHIMGALGLLTMIPGLIIDIYFLIEWLITRSLHVRPIMVLGISLIIVSIQFFSLGFISDMIIQRNSKDIEYNFEEIFPIQK